jgi:hypothetical protein
MAVAVTIIIIPTDDKQIHILLSVFSYGSSLEQFLVAQCPNWKCRSTHSTNIVATSFRATKWTRQDAQKATLPLLSCSQVCTPRTLDSRTVGEATEYPALIWTRYANGSVGTWMGHGPPSTATPVEVGGGHKLYSHFCHITCWPTVALPIQTATHLLSD